MVLTTLEKLDLATVFTIGDHAMGDTITVEMTDNGQVPNSGDGVKRWAVRDGRQCMSLKGVWEYEPMPSNRTRAWLKRFRFLDLDAALDAAKKAYEKRHAERQEFLASRNNG